ncbi:glycosyltransferase [Celeribacter persicus]|uniref:Glycosyltransferase involved in cell wall biosynthesis n=1 Tax=Celeribacter persicus TaxID=1651082 RepID=A0A2T5H9S6_9RHOB|nr:glycosyltransferase [Celeribacter persicus]PTQ68335.1 glycosyltransferase involved in cell wall biosynthesis [Celeribacter persicus]
MPNPQRIALVSAFPPGRQSLNEYGLHLARELAAFPDVEEIVVIAEKLAISEPELDLGPKIRVCRVWSFNRLSAGPAILRALYREEVDGVLWNLQMASFGNRELPAALALLTPALARLAGWRSGVIAHNLVSGIDLDNTQLKGRPIRQAIVRSAGAVVTRALLSADYMTVTLTSYAEMLHDRYPRVEVHHIPHGTFDTAARTLPKLSERPKRIVTMGKFGTYKRLETLLAAFDLMRAMPEFADYQLVIGGMDHPAAPGYLDRVARMREGDEGVVFHGYVAEEDVPDFFSQARLSVFDYNATTGSSGVLHQAVSYETVPIFPNIGDFVDVCEHEGLRGMNYTPGKPVELAWVMRKALGDLVAAQRLVEKNRVASQDIPLSQIARFHVAMLRMSRRQRPELSQISA